MAGPRSSSGDSNCCGAKTTFVTTTCGWRWPALDRLAVPYAVMGGWAGPLGVAEHLEQALAERA